MSCCVLLCGAHAQQGNAALRRAAAIAVDGSGNLYVADPAANQVIELTLAGDRVVFAGTGVQGFGGDGGAATSGMLNAPQGLAFGTDGSLYVADTGNRRIRVVSPEGILRTFAGTGGAADAGDGGAASLAQFDHPTALAVEATGALLVCDTNHHRVRRIDHGTIAAFAGTGVQGFAGDGGPAEQALLDSPAGLAVTADGRTWIADTGNARIRAVLPSGIVETYAGSGAHGYGGDAGPARAASLAEPRGLWLDAQNNLYVADLGNNRIRRIDAGGSITTVLGGGGEGDSLDGTAQSISTLRQPAAVAITLFGDLVATDSLNGTLRIVMPDGTVYQPAALVTGGRTSRLALQSSVRTVYGQGRLPVAVTGSVGVARGTLVASVSGSSIAADTIVGGTTALDLSRVNAGDYAMDIFYGGDGLNRSSRTSGVQLHVDPLVVEAVAPSVNVSYGAPYPAPGGTLTGVLARDAGEVAVLFQPPGIAGLLAPGVYPLTPTLTGTRAQNYTATIAAGSGTLTVLRAPNSIRVSAPASAYVSMPVQLQATVLPAFRGQPGGSAQLLVNGATAATSSVQNGIATFTYTPAAAGTQELSVLYPGDSNFLPANSAPKPLAVLALPDFGVTIATTGASTAAGQNAIYTLTVQSLTEPFTGSVKFSVQGLPAGATAVFSPPAVVPGSSAATVTLTVQTANAAAVALRTDNVSGVRSAFCFAGLLSVFSLSGRSRKRVAVLAVALFLTGCGARTVGEATDGIVAHTYALSCVGTATNLAGVVVTHSVPLTLTVNGTSSP